MRFQFLHRFSPSSVSLGTKNLENVPAGVLEFLAGNKNGCFCSRSEPSAPRNQRYPLGASGPLPCPGSWCGPIHQDPAVPHHNPLCKELFGLLVGPGTKPDAEDGNGCGQDDNGHEMAAANRNVTMLFIVIQKLNLLQASLPDGLSHPEP